MMPRVSMKNRGEATDLLGVEGGGGRMGARGGGYFWIKRIGMTVGNPRKLP